MQNRFQIFKQMKIFPFLVASIDYMLFFALRSTYFYVKPCLKDHYHLTDLFLALMDVSLFFGIATSYLLRFCFIDPQNRIKSFQTAIITLFTCITLIGLTPQLSSYIPTFQHTQVLLVLLIYFLGVPTACLESFLFQKVMQSYKGENSQMLYAFWSGCGHLGKVIGFVAMPPLIIDLHLSWSQTLMILNLILLLANSLVYLYFRYSQHEISEQPQRKSFNCQILVKNQEQVQSMPITHQEFFNFIPLLLFRRKTIIYFLLVVCSKALGQNLLIWLPVYLSSHNYQKFASINSFVYILPIIFGSFMIGFIHRYQANKVKKIEDSNCFLLTFALCSTLGFLILAFTLLNHVQFMLIVSLQGIVVGGFCNVLLENQGVSENLTQRQNEMLTVVIKTSTLVGQGLLDLVIGVTLQIKEQTNGKNMHNYDAIFEVLLVGSIICLGLFVYWYNEVRNRLQKNESQQLACV